jgi:hypothetical protein
MKRTVNAVPKVEEGKKCFKERRGIQNTKNMFPMALPSHPFITKSVWG